MAKEKLQAVIDKLGLTVEAEFVPFSRSLYAVPDPKIKDLCLNWVVTLKRNGSVILTAQFSSGVGYCPSYSHRITSDVAEKLHFECEHGREAVRRDYWAPIREGEPIMPDPVNVISSLARDADVLNHRSFEDWAMEYGYDEDSRKAEQMYRECLELALRLRYAIGDEGLRELQDAAYDY